MGREKWQERLPPYLSAQPEPNNDDVVYGLIEEAQQALKKVDVLNAAAYLEGVMATMKRGSGRWARTLHGGKSWR